MVQAVRLPSVFCRHWWHVAPLSLSYTCARAVALIVEDVFVIVVLEVAACALLIRAASRSERACATASSVCGAVCVGDLSIQRRARIPEH